jgi:phage-related protein
MKEVVWNKAAREYVRSLDKGTKIEVGALLTLLQKGHVLGMPQSRKMDSIHKGAFELRIKDKGGENRIIYALIFMDKILIPHAFRKKTPKTSKKDIGTAQKRLMELIDENE